MIVSSVARKAHAAPSKISVSSLPYRHLLKLGVPPHSLYIPFLFRRRKPGDPPGGTGDVAFKVALDRFLLTPPYLAITLASLRLLQGLGAKRSLGETRALYKGVLFTNWKVGVWLSTRCCNSERFA